jgi:uncharacterized protein (DUF1684 family)
LAYSCDIRHDGTIMMTSILVLGLLAARIPAEAVAQQTEETQAWRQHREEELKKDRSWLAVSGLPWLKEGDTTIGSADGSGIRLGDGPANWGTIVRAGSRVSRRPIDGPSVEITTEDPPFQIGRTWIQLIQRGERIGLRMWDPQNERKLAFPGLEWYEVKPEYRVQARLIKSATPLVVKVANVIGQVNDFASPGVVEFELNGETLQLTPVFETPAHDELFYIFKDGSSAKTTYGAGRFVYSAPPDKDGLLILDFNRAYSPPCAFTDFATCPLPPPVNRLTVPIEAGEKDPHPAR